MQAIQFGSTSENPTNFGANPTRTLSWGLHDGDDYSDPVKLTQITINAIDDPAMAQNDAVGTAEDTAITTGTCSPTTAPASTTIPMVVRLW